MMLKNETSRILKAMVDSGRYSFPVAQARLAAATLTVHLDAAVAGEPAAQAAAITALATAARCFPGGVWLSGPHDTPLVVPGCAATIGEMAVELGVRVGTPVTSRTVIIGPEPHAAPIWAIRAWWDGWLTGIRPRADAISPGDGSNSLSGIAAGALAVGHAFRAESGEDAFGPRLAQVISLWSPGTVEQGPAHFYLPDALWLVGLGNLGQAYLWCLGFLPYRKPSDLQLFLQDADVVRDVNWGTSLLVRSGCYGMLKTRLAEDWAIDRGFRVRRIDRFIDATTQRTPTEPAIALSGLDSIAARMLLDSTGFDRVVDCGLGNDAAGYHRFRLNVFSPDYGACQHFAEIAHEEEKRTADAKMRNLNLPAYKDGEAVHPDGICGMAELAGASVAAPFVSAFAATLAVTQAIRMANDCPHDRSMVGTVSAPEGIRRSMATPSPFRIGFAEPTRIAVAAGNNERPKATVP
jgi:hypothetical protein